MCMSVFLCVSVCVISFWERVCFCVRSWFAFNSRRDEVVYVRFKHEKEDRSEFGKAETVCVLCTCRKSVWCDRGCLVKEREREMMVMVVLLLLSSLLLLLLFVWQLLLLAAKCSTWIYKYLCLCISLDYTKPTREVDACIEFVCVSVRSGFAHSTKIADLFLAESKECVCKCKRERERKKRTSHRIVHTHTHTHSHENLRVQEQMRDRFVIGDSFKSAMVLGFEVLGC